MFFFSSPPRVPGEIRVGFFFDDNDETDEIGGFYGCEPEYTEGELKAILSEAENENSNTSSSKEELDLSRLLT